MGEEPEGFINKGIGAIQGLFGGKNTETQKIYVDVPNEILQKFIPDMLEEMKKLKEEINNSD